MLDNFEEIECFSYLNEESNITNMQDEFDSFKKSLNEEDIILANLIERKVSEIHEEKEILKHIKLRDEAALKEFTNKIVMEKINSAYINVLKEEYNKKISIICNESKQNQKNIAKKIHSDNEIKVEELKSKNKQLEIEIENQKSISINKIESLETEWAAKFKKLKEDKNDEITRHLKKSIDLIDENELLENQLEKLYLMIKKKSEQINSYEEQIYKYQNDIKKIQLEAKDFLGYQLKSHKTQEKAVECLILSNLYNSPYNDHSCNDKINEILKNDQCREKNLDVTDNKFQPNQSLTNQESSLQRNEDGLLNKNNVNDEKRMNNQRNFGGKLLDYNEQYQFINNLKNVLSYIKNNDLNKLENKVVKSENKSRNNNFNELVNKPADIVSLSNLIMLFLNENSGSVGNNIENLLYQNMPNSNSDFSYEDFDNEEETLNLCVKLKDERNNANNNRFNNSHIFSAISKSISINASIEEYISQKMSQIIQASQEQNLNSFSSSSFSAPLTEKSSKNKKNSMTESFSSESHIQPTLSIEESSREISLNDREKNFFGNNITDDELVNKFEVDPDNYKEQFLENLIETNLKVEKSVKNVFMMLEESNKELVESQYKQSLLTKQLEDNETKFKIIKNKYMEINEDKNEYEHDELIKKINNLEGLATAYEIDIQSKNKTLHQLEQELEKTKADLNELNNFKETSQSEIESLQSNNKELREQQQLLVHNIDDEKLNQVLQTNGILLEEKHQLIYKLRKETEMSNFQIRELEETIEKLNSELKCIKDNYEDQLFDLKKQTQSMESQLKSEKEFVNAQLSEREQERDEYETKIKQLSNLVDLKSIQVVEKDDNSIHTRIQDLELKNKELEILLQEKMDKLNKLSIVNNELERTLNEKDFSNSNLQKDTASEEEILQYKKEINTMLITNKKQNETLDFLKEKLSEKERVNSDLQEINETSAAKTKSLTEERDLVQTELYSYMSRFSDLQIHKENLEVEFTEHKTRTEEKIHSLTFSIKAKDAQLEEYKLKCIEMNENLENRLERELSQSKIEYEKYISDNDKLKKEVSTLENNIITLKNNLFNKEKEFEVEKQNVNKLSQNLIESKNEEIEDLNNIIDNIKTSKQQNEKVITDLKEEYQIACDLNSETKAGLETKIEELKNIIDDHMSTIVSNNNQIRNLELEAKNLNDELKVKEDKLASKNLESVPKKVYEELKEKYNKFEENYKVEKELLDELEEKLKNLDEQFILRTEHQSVIDSLMSDFENQLKIFNKENLSSEESISPDISFSNDLGKKLIDEIKLNKILDNELAEEINKESKNKDMPDNIKEIERMALKNINELSIKDLLEYKSYFTVEMTIPSKKSSREINQESFMKIQLLEQEKKTYLEEIFNLKNLLSILKTNYTENELLYVVNEINEIFTKENDLLINDLKKYVVNSSNNGDNYDQIVEINEKVILQIQYQKSFLEKLKSVGDNYNNKLLAFQESELEYTNQLKTIEENMSEELGKKNILQEKLDEQIVKVAQLNNKLNEEQEINFKLQKKINKIEDELTSDKEQLDNTKKEIDFLNKENLSLTNSINSLKKNISQSNNFQELFNEEKSKNEKIQTIVSEMKLKEKSQNSGMYQNTINLERLRQALEHTALKIKFLFETTDYSNHHKHNLAITLNSVIREIESIAEKINMNFLNDKFNLSSNSLYEKKIIEQNKDLLSTIKKLNLEKLQRDEEIKQFHKMRKNATSSLTDHDKEKFKKLYLKYLRAESFRKSLVYQKRFLIIMLSGYEETEREILATLNFESGLYNNSNQSSSHSSSNGSPNNSYAVKKKQSEYFNNIQRNHHSTEIQQLRNNTCSIYSSRFRIFKAKSRFRTAVISLIAISRIKFLVRKHSGILGKVDNFYKN